MNFAPRAFRLAAAFCAIGLVSAVSDPARAQGEPATGENVAAVSPTARFDEADTGAEAREATPAPVAFSRATINRVGEGFEAKLSSVEDLSSKAASVRFIAETIQVDLRGAAFPKGKTMLTSEDRTVRSVYIYEPEQGTVRVRFVLNKGLSARSFLGAVQVARLENGLGIRVVGAGQKAKGKRHQQELERKVAVLDGFPTLETPGAREEIADVPAKLTAGGASAAVTEPAATGKAQTTKPDASAQAATPESAIAVARAMDAKASTPAQVNALGSTVASPDAGGARSGDATGGKSSRSAASKPVSAASDTEADTNKINYKAAESEIPVSAVGKPGKQSDSDPLRRALFGAVALAVALAAVLYGTKKYAKRPLGGKQNAKIQVLGQHFLGPKKSLAIVHVAGESMLLGITDNNISLIKSLSLIDDEVPAHLPNNFDAAMDQDTGEQAYEQPYEDSYEEEGAMLQPEAGRPAPRARADADGEDRDNFAMRGLNEIRDVVSRGGGRSAGRFFGRFSAGEPDARKRR